MGVFRTCFLMVAIFLLQHFVQYDMWLKVAEVFEMYFVVLYQAFEYSVTLGVWQGYVGGGI